MEKCIFIEYPEGYKSWKFYNSVTKKVIISERADFDESYTYEETLIKSRESGDDMRPLIPMESDEMPVVNELKPQADPAPAVDSDDSDNDREIRPITSRRSTRIIKPPGEWWKVRQSTSVIASDSEDDENANVVVSGEIDSLAVYWVQRCYRRTSLAQSPHEVLESINQH